MSTTVEALEQAYKIINKGLPVTDPEVWGISRQLREAIPRAELEGQAVELTPRVLQVLRTAIELIEQEIPDCETADEKALMNLMDTILAQIETLKAKDGTRAA